MDIDKIIREWFFKLPKGYAEQPYSEDELESLAEVLVEQNVLMPKASLLNEASLSGGANGYGTKTPGAFEKYVVHNPKVDNIPCPGGWVTTGKNIAVFNVNTKNKIEVEDTKGGKKQYLTFNNKTSIKKIITRSSKDLVKIGAAKCAKVDIGGTEYYIKLANILKPTCKGAVEFKVDLAHKLTKGQYRKFSSQHKQERAVVELFINNSGAAWEFEHKSELYVIQAVGDPVGSGMPQPKTDVLVELDKTPPGLTSPMLKISLKEPNASYVESHIKLERMLDIFGAAGVKKYILAAKEYANSDKMGVRAQFINFYIIDGKKGGNDQSATFNKAASNEVYSGRKKYASQNGKIANCYFKGTSTPASISEFLNGVKPIEQLKGDLYLNLEGRNQKLSANMLKRDEEGTWQIIGPWIAAAGL